MISDLFVTLIHLRRADTQQILGFMFWGNMYTFDRKCASFFMSKEVTTLEIDTFRAKVSDPDPNFAIRSRFSDNATPYIRNNS